MRSARPSDATRHVGRVPLPEVVSAPLSTVAGRTRFGDRVGVADAGRTCDRAVAERIARPGTGTA